MVVEATSDMPSLDQDVLVSKPGELLSVLTSDDSCDVGVISLADNENVLELLSERLKASELETSDAPKSSDRLDALAICSDPNELAKLLSSRVVAEEEAKVVLKLPYSTELGAAELDFATDGYDDPEVNASETDSVITKCRLSVAVNAELDCGLTTELTSRHSKLEVASSTLCSRDSEGTLA